MANRTPSKSQVQQTASVGERILRKLDRLSARVVSISKQLDDVLHTLKENEMTKPNQDLPGSGGRPNQDLPGRAARPDNSLPESGAPDQGLPGDAPSIDNELPSPLPGRLAGIGDGIFKAIVGSAVISLTAVSRGPATTEERIDALEGLEEYCAELASGLAEPEPK